MKRAEESYKTSGLTNTLYLLLVQTDMESENSELSQHKICHSLMHLLLNFLTSFIKASMLLWCRRVHTAVNNIANC